MNKFWLLFITGLLLVSCGSKANQTVEPTPTVSFSEVQSLIEPILYYDGEIAQKSRDNWPGGVYVGRIPKEFTEFGNPIFVFGKEILNLAYDQTGYVLMIKYATSEELDKSFNDIDGASTTAFGEIGKSIDLPDHWIQAAFIRCGYLVFIRSFGPTLEEVENYAYQLEGRLMPVICTSQQ
jgi:hypothetical protein